MGNNHIKKILMAALAVMVAAHGAKAIVFIPPVIYVATLSIGSFIINLCAFLAVWLAAGGIINHRYFGKAMHEIVRFILGLAGKAALLVLAATVPVLLLNPLNKQDIVFASLVAGVLSFSLLFLSVFRRYRLAQRGEKMPLVRSLVFFSVLVVLVTFVSASMALETKTLRTRNGGVSTLSDNGTKGFNSPSNSAGFSMPSKQKKTAGFREALPESDSQNKTEELAPIQGVQEEMWFYPVSFDLCEIYFDNSRIMAAYPAKNCYYYGGSGETEKIPCPISVSSSLAPINASGNLYGKGSCTENYSVSVSKDGFNISGQ